MNESRSGIFHGSLNAGRGDGSMPISTRYDGPGLVTAKFEGVLQ